MAKDDDSKLFAFLGVLLTIVGFIIVYATRKNDKYAMFYAKQGVVLFIAFLIAWIVAMVPIVGWIAGLVLNILAIVGWILEMIYALSGKEKEVPIIGKFAENF